MNYVKHNFKIVLHHHVNGFKFHIFVLYYI